MIRANDQLTNRAGRIIEQWLDGENYIILSNDKPNYKDGGTLDVH